MISIETNKPFIVEGKKKKKNGNGGKGPKKSDSKLGKHKTMAPG